MRHYSRSAHGVRSNGSTPLRYKARSRHSEGPVRRRKELIYHAAADVLARICDIVVETAASLFSRTTLPSQQCQMLEPRFMLSGTDSFGCGGHYFDQAAFSLSGQSQQVVKSNPDAVGAVDASSTAAPIRYFDGHAEISVTDLFSNGFGEMWGVTRSWSPDMQGAGLLGNHWFINQLPQLVSASGSIILVGSGTDQRWFDETDGIWVERYGGQDTLVEDTTNHTYTLTDTSGGRTVFYSFTGAPTGQEGQFRSFTDLYGNETSVHSVDGSGNITEVRRSNGSVVESWQYTYTTLASTSIVISNVRLRRSTDSGSSWTAVRQVSYSYYGSGESGGNTDDLRSAQIQIPGPDQPSASLTSSGSLTVGQTYYYVITANTSDGETGPSPEITITPTSGNQTAHLSWSSYPGATSYNIYGATASGRAVLIASSVNATTYDDGSNSSIGDAPTGTLDTYYYRYYTSGTSTGYLKYVFGPQAYDRAAAALGSLDSASDANLDDYADNAFTYRGTSINGVYPVSEEVAAGFGGTSTGGQGTFSYTYSSSGLTHAFNTWEYKTVETLPDGNSNTVYSNYAGEPILEVFTSDGTHWGTFYEYDDQGRVILQASPSALSLPSSLDTLDYYADVLDNVSGNYKYLRDDAGLIYTTSYYDVGWSFGGTTGITADDSTVTGSGTLDAPDGAQAAFVRGTGTVTQTVTAASSTGTLTFSFEAAQGDGSTSQTLQVLIDGSPQTITGLGTNWLSVQPSGSYTSFSATFTLSAGSHTIQFAGGGGDDSYTALIDDVTLTGTGAPSLSDASFESLGLVDAEYVICPPGATADSSTAGGIRGYVHETFLQNGEFATPVLQETKSYIVRTDGATSGNPVLVGAVAEDTVYRNADGTGGETTSYAYTWYSSSVQPETITISHPKITTAENGPGTSEAADTEVFTFDQFNRMTQYDDAGGYTHTATYDTATGALTETVTDSGSGHLNLTTDYVVDGLGRTTQTTDPNGNDTYIVYNDLDHEVRQYPGWHEIAGSSPTTYTTTGPVTILREYRPEASAPSTQRTLYDELLTISPPIESSSTPSGTESIAASNIVSLTRSLTNSAGQISELDAYYSLAGLSYSTATPQLASASSTNDSASGNYHATLYAYDSRGHNNRREAPTGTITATTYDGLGRVTSVSVGTVDTGSSNMVDVQDYTYDQRLAAPSAPTLGQDTGVGYSRPGTYYVKVTYVSESGESVASTEASYTVTSGALTVTVPTRSGASGYNVYVGNSSGYEMQQSSSAVTAGTAWTMPDSSLVDGALTPVDEMGDGNLTEMTQYPGGGATDRVTMFLYDWRDRLVAEKAGVESSESTGLNRQVYLRTLDNLGEITGTYQYDGDAVNLRDCASGQPSADASKLRAQQLTSYDEQQRPYLTQTYSVDQTCGTVSSTSVLSTNFYYDRRGNLAAESDPGGLVYKWEFDGANRNTVDSTTDGGVLGGASQDWSTAMTTDDDIVLEQTLTTYDDSSNVVETIYRERFDNDPTTASGQGDLAGPSGSNVASRDYYTDYYYDAANRITAQANVGTNGGTSWSRPSSPDSRSDSYLLTTYSYAADAIETVIVSGGPTGGTFTLTFDGQTTSNIAYDAPANGASSVQAALEALSNIDSGDVAVTGDDGGPYTVRFMGNLTGAQPLMTSSWSLTGGGSGSAVSAVLSQVGGDAGFAQQTTDPRGIVSKSDIDMLGRTVRTIQAFSTGIPSNAADQTTAYTYDGDGNPLTMTAMVPSGSANQTTGYVYGIGSSGQLYSNDILLEIDYPNKTYGYADSSSSTTFGYNYLGEKTSYTDLNGTTHTYDYDVLGRPIMDSAAVAGGNPWSIDQSVLSLGFTYDTAGRPYQQTSYSGVSGSGSVVNQVTNTYNGFGQLTNQGQYLGSGSASGSVQYVFNETNNGTENNSRLRSIVYPNGRVVDYDYSNSQTPISTITHSGTTATATTSSSHGLSTGDVVVIEGATPALYDGTFTITVTGATAFTYTMDDTPGSNATGSYKTVAKVTLDTVISRTDGLQNHSGSTVVEGYTYLGLSTIVQRTHPETGIELTYIEQASDPNPPPSGAATGGDRYVGLDQFGRVVDQFWVNPSSLSTPTDRFQYAYDRDGNVLYKNVIGSGSGSATFSELYHANGSGEYDSLNRETVFRRGTLSASGSSMLNTVADGALNSMSGHSESWTLDALGNWSGSSAVTIDGTAQSRSVDSSNEYTDVGGNTPTYDDNGNMTLDETGIAYTYDAWNRLRTAGGINAIYGYTALGQRAAVTGCIATTTYSFFSVSWQDLEDDVDAGGCGGYNRSTYVWGLGYVDDLVARTDASGSTLYVQQDASFNVTALIDSSGSVVGRFVYDPYGNSTVLSSSWTTSSGSAADDWVYRYKGGRYDTYTGLYNFRNRDYSPTLGRWMQQDPTGYVDGANLYEGWLGAPIGTADPLGLGGATPAGSGSGNRAPSPHIPLQDLDKLISQLGAERFEDREKAEEALKDVWCKDGSSVLKHIEDILTVNNQPGPKYDPEIIMRLRDLYLSLYASVWEKSGAEDATFHLAKYQNGQWEVDQNSTVRIVVQSGSGVYSLPGTALQMSDPAHTVGVQVKVTPTPPNSFGKLLPHGKGAPIQPPYEYLDQYITTFYTIDMQANLGGRTDVEISFRPFPIRGGDRGAVTTIPIFIIVPKTVRWRTRQ